MADKYDIYMKKADEANYCAQAICDDIIAAAKVNPDAVRAILGSVGFRSLEEYVSRREQADAAFTEWFHEMTAVEKPFG